MQSATARAAQKPEDARAHLRQDVKIEIAAQSGHQFFTGFTENISAGGLFVSTYQTMPLGSKFAINFTIPGIEYEFELQCEVRWVREYSEMTPHMTPGMGVRFLDMTPGEVQILNQLLQRMETMFYDDEDDFGF